jgi:hypothetical protein
VNNNFLKAGGIFPPAFSVKKIGLYLVKNDSASKIVIGIYRKEEKQ